MQFCKQRSSDMWVGVCGRLVIKFGWLKLGKGIDSAISRIKERPEADIELRNLLLRCKKEVCWEAVL